MQGFGSSVEVEPASKAGGTEGASPCPPAAGGSQKAVPLGSIAKSSTPPPPKPRKSPPEPSSAAYVFWLQGGQRELLPQEHRLQYCLRVRHLNAETVDVVYYPERRKANYQGLQTCGSVWQCVPCARKVSHERQQEVTHLLDQVLRAGGAGWMVTLTLSHHQGDNLEELLRVLKAAYSSVFSGQVWGKWRERLGWIGAVRGLENTYGENGFHPHMHILQTSSFRPSDTVLAEFASWAREKYIRVVERLGGSATKTRGLNVLLDVEDATYLDKDASWNLSHEVTKAVSKTSKGPQGRSMNRLLHDYLTGDEQAGYLYQVYAQAFKGQRHLVWSQGLKSQYGIAEMDDQQAAQVDLETARRVLASLTPAEYRQVLKFAKQGEVLDVAALGCKETLRVYLEMEGVL